MKLGKSVNDKGRKAQNKIHDTLLSEREPIPCFGMIEWIEQTIVVTLSTVIRNLNYI